MPGKRGEVFAEGRKCDKDLRIWGFEDLGIWRFEVLGFWGFEVLRFWGFGVFLEFGIWNLEFEI